jgi:MYXO-CTERM domain-containing protein
VRAARLVLAAIACATAAGAGAYERTLAALCETCLYWSSLAPIAGAPWELRYQVHRDGSRSTSCAGEPGLAAVQASFRTWSEVACSHLRIGYGGETGDGRVGLDGRNLVAFRAGPCDGRVPPTDPCWDSGDGACANAYGCWEDGPLVLATTVVTHHAVSGVIYDADIEVNDWGGLPGDLPAAPDSGSPPPDGWYFTCDPPPGGTSVPALCGTYGATGCAYADLQNTITHEAGHVLGLWHTDTASATMWAYADLREIVKRDLDADDVAGLCAIYPAGEAPTTCPGLDLPECQGSGSGCGCRSGGGGGAPIALAALFLALAPRRRSGLPRRRG